MSKTHRMNPLFKHIKGRNLLNNAATVQSAIGGKCWGGVGWAGDGCHHLLSYTLLLVMRIFTRYTRRKIGSEKARSG